MQQKDMPPPMAQWQLNGGTLMVQPASEYLLGDSYVDISATLY